MPNYKRIDTTNPLDAAETAYKALSMMRPLDPVMATRAINACRDLEELDSDNAERYAEIIEKIEDLYLRDNRT